MRDGHAVDDMRVAIEGQDIADMNVGVGRAHQAALALDGIDRADACAVADQLIGVGEIVQEHVIEILLELILKIHDASSRGAFFLQYNLLF